MKPKRLLMCAVLILLVLSSISKASIVAKYHFDEALTDGGSSTIENAVSSSWGDGTSYGASNTSLPYLNEAFWFNGSDVVTTNNRLSSTGDWTIAGWARISANIGTSRSCMYAVFKTGADGCMYLMAADGAVAGSKVRLKIFSSGGTFVDLYSADNIIDNEYHFIAATREGDTFSLYVDGILEDSVTANGVSLYNGTDRTLCIGNLSTSEKLGAYGAFDEMSIYDNALSSEDVYDVFLNRIAEYHFDETLTDGGSSTVINDAPGNWGNATSYGPSNTSLPYLDESFWFYGSDVVSTNNRLPTTEDWTITGWARVSPDIGINRSCMYAVYKTGAEGCMYLMAADTTITGSKVRLKIFGSSETWVDLYSASNILDNEYHFIAATRNGDTFSLYVDGTLEDSVTVSGVSLYQGADRTLCIGNISVAQYLVAYGAYDEMNIYDKALTPPQIANLYLDYPSQRAYDSSPADDKLVVDAALSSLSWELPEPIDSSNTKDDLKVDVFISENADMSNATQLVNYQNATSVSISPTSGTKYYWRVDTYDPRDGGTEVKKDGRVWSFTYYRGTAIVQVIDEDLDMATQLETYESIVEEETGPALVEYGPRLVVGQGDDEDNYTVVRVLNKFQISELQFLAYPTSVRGGVNVCAGSLFSDDQVVVTCPISDASTREIRVFSQEGQLIETFDVSSNINPPFVITVGDFISGNDYEEIAVASRTLDSDNMDILIYSGDGVLLGMDAPSIYYDDITMSTLRGDSVDKVLVYCQSNKTAVSVQFKSGYTSKTYYSLSSLPSGCGLYQSAFEDETFVAGAQETTFSTLYRIGDQLNMTSTDAGVKENRFWVYSYGDRNSWNESQYIKHGYYRHIRTDYYSDNYFNPDLSSDVYSDWVGSSIDYYINSCFSDYHSGWPSIWEPTFTHRHASTILPDEWYDEIDDNGFNKYLMLNCYNEPLTFDSGAFDCLTYATGLPAIDRLYLWPQRAFLRELALYLRGPNGDAEKMVAVEPNHEFEIPDCPGVLSIGDYNPKMISGFYNHLIERYTTIGHVNSLFGTSFTGPGNFDAPRNLSRGSWDAYGTSNEFYNEWIEYNRKIIFLRVAQGFREALIAGLPPEAIKTHLTPQGYAAAQPINSLRITPIDWIFTAGTGYGGTRYGVWYTNQYNWVQGAFSSGQTNISAGEYDPITTSQTSANNQLSYMFNNGVNFVHYMVYTDPNIVCNSCVSLQDDGPRPGTTGGIGQIRAVSQPTDDGVKPYNIVCVGTGPNRNGLLKSVNKDGSWEGTVYVTPFHAAIDIDVIGTEDNDFHLTTSDYGTGTINGLMAGDQIEIRLKARTNDQNGELTLLPLHAGIELARHRKCLQIDDEWGYYNYVLRVQSPMEGVIILMNSGRRDTSTAYAQDIEIEDFSIYVHKDRVARKRYGILAGTPHAGGVTFDILSGSHKTTRAVGGNDIAESEVSSDAYKLYFGTEISQSLTDDTDLDSMTLFINADQDMTTGWNGYEYRVNRYRTDAVLTLEKCLGGWNWEIINNLPYLYSENQLEIAIPRSLISQDNNKNIAFDFNWIGNVQTEEDNLTNYRFKRYTKSTPATYFEQDGDFEGWSMANNLSNETVSGGVLNCDITGFDAFMVNGASFQVNSQTYQYLHIRMRNQSASTTAQVYWTNSVHTTWSELSHQDFTIVPNDTEFRDYYINLGSHYRWVDDVYSLRLDPGNASSGNIEIEFIRLQDRLPVCGDFGYKKPDLSLDCMIDYQDLAIMAAQWLQSGFDYNYADVNRDLAIDTLDLEMLAEQWLDDGIEIK